MRCSQCSTKNPPSAQFCGNCGHQLYAPPPPPPSGRGGGSAENQPIRRVLMAIMGVIVTLAVTLASSALLPRITSIFQPEPETAASVATVALPTATPLVIDTAAPLPEPTSSPAPIVATPVPPLGTDNVFVEYIVDASNSMLDTIDGKTKLAIAQEMLAQRIAALPPDINLGMRVYGHRLRWQDGEAQSCNDIELVVPLSPSGGDAILNWLPTMQALGMTPMSEAIRQAAEDFTFTPDRQNSIILLSDGKESCGEDPATVVGFLREVGIDFTIHVIGLDVDDETAAQLNAIAEAGGGAFLRADNEPQLAAALDSIQTSVVDRAAASAEIDAQAPSNATLSYQNDELGIAFDYSAEYAIAPDIDRNGLPRLNLSANGVAQGRITLVDSPQTAADFLDAVWTNNGKWTNPEFELLQPIQSYQANDNDIASIRFRWPATADNAAAYAEYAVAWNSQRIAFVESLDGDSAPIDALVNSLRLYSPANVAVPVTVNAASEGAVSASSVYSNDFLPSFAIDGNPATSWFSAGPNGGITSFIWTGQQDDLIESIRLVGNGAHAVAEFRQNFGFGAVTVQVKDVQGAVVFEHVADLSGTPDPDVLVQPNVVGRSVTLIFTGHEAPDCGGFGELEINVRR